MMDEWTEVTAIGGVAFRLKNCKHAQSKSAVYCILGDFSATTFH